MPGGVVIGNNKQDEKGYKIVDDRIIDQFVFYIKHIIDGVSSATEQYFKKTIINSGQINISKIDWKNIVPMYHKVFSGELK